MREALAVISVLILVTVAGCAGPLGQSPSTDTPTPEPEPSPTPTITPTPDPSEQLPPGVTSDGIGNASQLLDAHVTELSRTGFVGVGTGNGTIYRDGFLVDVESHQRNVVEPEVSSYLRQRSIIAGPVRNEWQAWGNASDEYRRSKEGNGWKYERKEPAPPAKLAGRGLLLPYLRGGNYTVERFETDNNETRFRLVSTEVEDPDALMEALPDDTEEITSFEATVVVDMDGRIHSVQATAEYVIRGEEATHQLEYRLEQVRGVTIDRPDWVDAARNQTGNG